MNGPALDLAGVRVFQLQHVFEHHHRFRADDKGERFAQASAASIKGVRRF